MKIPFLFFLFLFVSACHSQTSTRTSQNVDLPPSSFKQAVYFDVGDDAIKNQDVIHHNAAWMKGHPEKVVVLEGHCDERGDREYNLNLGDRRARAVMKALMEEGVPENQLVIISYGKDRPVVKARSENGWAENRRVNFVLR